MNGHILLVEDEKALRAALEVRLRTEGYTLDSAADGEEGLRKATNLAFDLIILDVVLPIRNGFDLCREIRREGLATNILMLTVRDQPVDKVVGLQLGADDYMTKPFYPAELVARIQALLGRQPDCAKLANYEFDSIHVDVPRGEVTRDGNKIHFARREFQLLCYLIEQRGQSVSRRDLLRSIWGYDAGAYTRTVDIHIGSLRRKIEKNPERPELIVTVSSVGYKFEGALRQISIPP